MKTTNLFAILLAVLVANIFSARVWSDTFGSGANTFDIEFVTIGNPGNAADTTGNPGPPYPTGSVAYPYKMGKFEVSRDMVTKANASVASGGGNLGITLDDMSTHGGNGVNRPATGVSWNEAARFMNWLNTSSGRTPAYKFAIQPGEAGYSSNANIQLWTISDAGYNPNNLYRNSLARYVLPSVDEWYKAAYFDPISAVYYDYPTGSNSAPTAVPGGTAAGTAVHGQLSSTGPADITSAGGLSPYGTMGQGGNAFEWEETDVDLVNGPTQTAGVRGFRGGLWASSSITLMSSVRLNIYTPDQTDITVGFRVASIPEPDDIGDYNHNGVVDAADYVVWRKSAGTPAAYDTWRAHFGEPSGAGTAAAVNLPTEATVAEPATLALLTFATAGWCLRQRRKSHQLIDA